MLAPTLEHVRGAAGAAAPAQEDTAARSTRIEFAPSPDQEPSRNVDVRASGPACQRITVAIVKMELIRKILHIAHPVRRSLQGNRTLFVDLHWPQAVQAPGDRL